VLEADSLAIVSRVNLVFLGLSFGALLELDEFLFLISHVLAIHDTFNRVVRCEAAEQLVDRADSCLDRLFRILSQQLAVVVIDVLNVLLAQYDVFFKLWSVALADL
jgi:hypothetical protein